jgi:3-deoxy-7-phosphoheptulonate synthase
MRILMKADASTIELAEVMNLARERAGDPHLVEVAQADGRIAVDIAMVGHTIDPDVFVRLRGVETVEGGSSLYHLATDNAPSRKIIHIAPNDTEVGGDKFTVMAGPCAVENESDFLEVAIRLKALGVKILRGGAFKPRTSPYCFQGLGVEGLQILSRVREKTGMAIVTEAMDPGMVGAVSEVADIVQIGSRNMQNFPLLKAAGKQPKPVLLKRGMSATLEEWLAAAEYILAEGNPNVIMCERGIRTFSRHSRHTLDIGVIPALKEQSPLPVIVDPSHATGVRKRIPSMALAAMAAGADGIIVEVHVSPDKARSDSFQTISIEEFENLLSDLGKIGAAINRPL